LRRDEAVFPEQAPSTCRIKAAKDPRAHDLMRAQRALAICLSPFMVPDLKSCMKSSGL
jgi:hypothetical protein